MVLLNLFGGKKNKMSDIEYLARIAHGEIPGAKIKYIDYIEISESLEIPDMITREFEKTITTVPPEKDWYLISWYYRYDEYNASSITFNFGDYSESFTPRNREDYSGKLRGVKAEAGTNITVDSIQYSTRGSGGIFTYGFQAHVSMMVLELPAGASPEL